ncbi:MAG: hypothetical protein RIR65_2906, partial [Planctomycetota bacterium]
MRPRHAFFASAVLLTGLAGLPAPAPAVEARSEEAAPELVAWEELVGSPAGHLGRSVRV